MLCDNRCASHRHGQEYLCQDFRKIQKICHDFFFYDFNLNNKQTTYIRNATLR